MSGDDTQNQSSLLKTVAPVPPSESQYEPATTATKTESTIPSFKAMFLKELKRKWTADQCEVVNSLLEDDNELVLNYIIDGELDRAGFLNDINIEDTKCILTGPQRRWAWKQYAQLFAPERKRHRSENITRAATDCIVKPAYDSLLLWQELTRKRFSPKKTYVLGADFYEDVQSRIFHSNTTNMPFTPEFGYSTRDHDFWPAILESYLADQTGSEDVFHCQIDVIMYAIRKQIAPECGYKRNTVDESTEGQTRADVLIHFSGYLLFRGEEKLHNVEQPLPEISAKMKWVFGDVPYVFAYTSSGTQMHFYAIRPDPMDNSKLQIQPLGGGDIHTVGGRLAVLPIITTIFQLCNCIAAFIIDKNIPALKEKPKYNIDLFPVRDVCAKLYSTSQHQLAFNGAAVLKHLQDSGFEQVHKFVGPLWVAQGEYKNEKQKHTGITVKFSPIGYRRLPVNKEEARDCAQQLITLVENLHARRVVHRDIRWPNVLVRDGKWFLIDFDHAVIVPGDGKMDEIKIATHPDLANSKHSPEMALEYHTAAVDIWSLCYLFCKLPTAVEYFNAAYLSTVKDIKLGKVAASSVCVGDLRQITARDSM